MKSKYVLYCILPVLLATLVCCVTGENGPPEPTWFERYASFKSSYESSWLEEHATDPTAKRVEADQNTYLIWRGTETDDSTKSTHDLVIMQVLKKPGHSIPDLAFITVTFAKTVQDNLVDYHLSFTIFSDEAFFFNDIASVRINDEITELDGKTGSVQVSARQFNTYLSCNLDSLMGKDIKENSKIVVRTYIRQKDYLDIDIPSEFLSLVLSVL